MFLNAKMIIPFFIMFSSLNICLARELSIISHRINFTLKIKDQNQFGLKGPHVNLNMVKNKCNAKILEKFSNDIEALLRVRPLSKTKIPIPNAIKLIVDGKEFYRRRQSRVTRSFLSIPREFHRMKIQEKMLCKKGKSSQKAAKTGLLHRSRIGLTRCLDGPNIPWIIMGRRGLMSWEKDLVRNSL